VLSKLSVMFSNYVSAKNKIAALGYENTARDAISGKFHAS